MTKRSVPDMKEIFKQAAEIAREVPENMQEAAFNRALDVLIGSSQPASHKQEQAIPPPPRAPSEEESTKASPENLLRLIDSTQHPAVRSAGRTLDQSLMVLQIALRDHGIDGLTPVEIARILNEKFRLGTTRQAVGMALKGASNLVDRISEGRGFRYRIMAPGEKHLDHLASDSSDSDNAGRASGSKVPRRRKKVRRSRSNGGDKARREKPSEATKARSRNRKSSSVGPKAAILALVEEGFFDKAKTRTEVKDHLKKKKGHELGTDQIGMAMLRLLRDSVLTRDEREDGQYEYKRSS